jgi:hypothetical protein
MLKLPVGTVSLTFKKDNLSVTKSVTIKEGKNKSKFFKLK